MFSWGKDGREGCGISTPSWGACEGPLCLKLLLRCIGSVIYWCLRLCLIFTDRWVSWRPLMSEAVPSMIFSLADGEPYLNWVPLGLPSAPLSSGEGGHPLYHPCYSNITRLQQPPSGATAQVWEWWMSDPPSLSLCFSAKFTLMWLYSRSAKMI